MYFIISRTECSFVLISSILRYLTGFCMASETLKTVTIWKYFSFCKLHICHELDSNPVRKNCNYYKNKIFIVLLSAYLLQVICLTEGNKVIELNKKWVWFI